MLKAILLDGYGTLFDTGTGSVDAVREILLRNGRPDLSPQEFYSQWKVLHQAHMDSLPEFHTEGEIYALDLRELYRRYGLTGNWEEDVQVMLRIQGQRQVYPEVPGVLAQLKGRFQLAVASTTDTAPLLEDLKRGGLEFAPSRIFTSQSLRVYKPNPVFYTTILECLEVSPQEALFVGDSLVNDVEGPQRVGIPACWVDRKGRDSGKVSPEYRISSLRELPALVMSLAG